MKKYCILGGTMESQVDLASHLAAFFSKERTVLLWNLQRGDFVLREKYEMEDVIYDMDDYLLEQRSLEQVRTPIDENFSVIFSSYKKDKYQITEKDITKLDTFEEEIQISIGAHGEEIKTVKLWATDIIYLDHPEKEEKTTFSFGKGNKNVGIHLGNYPDEKTKDPYWEKLAMAILHGEDFPKKGFWESMKAWFSA